MEKWRKLEQQEMEKWWRRAQGQDSDAHGETTQVQERTHAASGKECTRERVEKRPAISPGGMHARREGRREDGEVNQPGLLAKLTEPSARV